MELEKLKLLLNGIIDVSVIDRFYELNGELSEPARTYKTAVEALNYAILQLENIKVGELSIDQKEKLQFLKALRDEYQKQLESFAKPRYGVFYVDRPKEEL
jgi:hypothetical protein